MVVMQCERAGCPNIMCDRLLNLKTHRCRLYICRDCFQELDVAKDLWPVDMARYELEERVLEFMRTPREEPDKPVDDEREREWELWWDDITLLRE